jgi:t-SNARE complex subunit (syntaxin)
MGKFSRKIRKRKRLVASIVAVVIALIMVLGGALPFFM